MTPRERRTDPPPARRRVTAPGTGRLAAPAARNHVEIGPSTDELGVIYLGALIRAQLRLALSCAAGFLAVITVLAMVIATTAPLHDSLVLGVPWSWALQAYAFYPVVVGFAVIYVVAARRNERRFRQLERVG